MLCVGMQPVTLRVTGRGASLEAFPRGSVRTITPTLYQPSAFKTVTGFTARIRTPAVPRRCISSR